MVTKLVIANRGEIARRILRTARKRGFRVAVISTPGDRDALVRGEADEVLEVESFLDARAIVDASRRWGADRLHPGYGFLAENADFAEAVERAGITFVGPSGESMRTLGNKESAKAIAESSGVPTLPAVGSEELAAFLDGGRLADELAARGVTPPYLIKASGGGGGRGMRIVSDADALPEAIRRGGEEARAGFGDPSVFVEQYLVSPRHIEIQVFGDGKGGGVFLGERECSMQRRHQKVVEEAPSVIVDSSLRIAMGKAALALVAVSRYRGAGTVEFLVDRDQRYFFLEVNTRLQVEHPVTEAIYGVDLVDAQLDLAEGDWPRSLPDPNNFTAVEPQGFAIEARVLAEDPRNAFLPTPGPLVVYREPHGEKIRVDSGVTEGGRVNSEFDSLIAKVIAQGATRWEALDRLERALESMIIHGPTTNLPFLQVLLRHPDFQSGLQSTTWIEEHLDELNVPLLPETLSERLTSRGFREKLSLTLSGGRSSPPSPIDSRFWAQGGAGARVGSGLERASIDIGKDDAPNAVSLSGPGLEETLRAASIDGYYYSGNLRILACQLREGHSASIGAFASRSALTQMSLTVFGETLRLADPRHAARAGLDVAVASSEVRAPMPGKVLEVRLKEGDRVEEGQVFFVIESMKIQLEVKSPATGKVREIHVRPGQVLPGPDLLATLESSAPSTGGREPSPSSPH